MVWPIGQPNGPLHRVAIRSRKLWSEFLEKTGLWNDPCGSLHVACRADELEVLREFSALAPELGYDCCLLSADEIERRWPAVENGATLGGLWSPTEMCVNPRQVIAQAPAWLRDCWGVDLQFGTCVSEIDVPKLRATDGSEWYFDRVTVASGVDCATLYPEVYRANKLGVCKLQMMRTVNQPHNWRLGILMAGGLTLRHYAAFRVCNSLKKLRERIAVESPELDRYGIHVMASQNGDGAVVIGDSHEYGDDIDPFDKELINQLIVLELQRFLRLPDWSIAERWHGIYATLADEIQFVRRPSPGVTIVIATGGCGMTMSFGLAENFVQQQMHNSADSSPDAMAVLAGLTP